MMAVYRNIGLYGFPVSYITVSIVVCVIAGALLLAATVLIFSEQKITSRARTSHSAKGETAEKDSQLSFILRGNKKDTALSTYASVCRRICGFDSVEL